MDLFFIHYRPVKDSRVTAVSHRTNLKVNIVFNKFIDRDLFKQSDIQSLSECIQRNRQFQFFFAIASTKMFRASKIFHLMTVLAEEETFRKFTPGHNIKN